MRVAWVLLVAGCNQIYGLDNTRVRDGSVKEFFDAPPDSAFTCPTTGVPQFKFELTQVPILECTSYVPSRTWGKALTTCSAGSAGSEIRQGEIDKAVSKATLDTQVALFEPRLWPDGDQVFFENLASFQEEVYKRNPDETWSFVGNAFPTNFFIDTTPPSRGPDRRVIRTEAMINTGIYQVTEMSDATGSWQIHDEYPLTDPNVIGVFHPSMTSDGLRLVAEGQLAAGVGKAIIFASRPNVGVRFGRFEVLATVPKAASYPHLDDDCGKIYFSAVDTVFFLEQI